MIVVDLGDRWRIVTQPDHARFAGELLALWRADGLPDHPRRSELIFAAREHDNGWRETDAAPHVDRETGRPHDFLTLPWDVRSEIWNRGVERFAEEHPYAALLIAEHALALHREHRGEPELASFFERLEERRTALLEETTAEPAEVAADYRFLALADQISLLTVLGRERSFEQGGVRGRIARETCHLDPFPLAGTTTFRIPCRVVPARRYSGDRDLAVELARARWEERAVKVAPS